MNRSESNGSLRALRPRPRRWSGGRSGFTLIELLVVMVIAGFVTTAIFQMLLGHQRTAQVQSAREEVQQNSRAAIELIAGELRAVGPDAIATAAPGEVVFRTPRAWGLVCGYVGGNRLVVAFPQHSVASVTTVAGMRLGIPPIDGGTAWTFPAVSDVTVTELPFAVPVCASLGADPALNSSDPATSQVRVYSGAPVSPDLQSGMRVYVTEQVTYAIGPDPSGLPGTWILRNGQTLAGPVPDVGGLAITYLDGTGSVLASTASAADRAAIRQVQLSVTTNSRAEFAGSPQKDSSTTVISLRNR
jgi:prepilin-type N-terminal cleavage/methylation domain-containing protein